MRFWEGQMAIDGLVIATNVNEPLETQKRKIGAVNFGFYCDNEKCRQFFAIMVFDDPEKQIVVSSDPPRSQSLLQCPFCQHQQFQILEDILRVRLTEGARQRPERDAPLMN
jgi:hypothetical protein